MRCPPDWWVVSVGCRTISEPHLAKAKLDVSSHECFRPRKVFVDSLGRRFVFAIAPFFIVLLFLAEDSEARLFDAVVTLAVVATSGRPGRALRVRRRLAQTG